MTRRRLAWIRWSMTLFFTLTTAVCTVGLAVFAAHQDSAARDRIDDHLVVQAQQIAQGLDIDEDGLVFSSGSASQNLNQPLGLSAIGSSPTAVIVNHRVEYSSPTSDALPSAVVLAHLVDSAGRTQSALATAPSQDDQSVRWVAVPVRTGDEAVVVLGDDTGPSGSHSAVVLDLALTVSGLIAATTFTGHVLSGIAMRPAVRSTHEQEQFLREAAHELRTPLMTLSLMTEAAIREPTTAGDALLAVHQRLGRLNMLVGSLLARAHANAHASDVEQRPLRLDQLVEVTVDELATEDRVVLDLTPTIVLGSQELLTQAARNLVENALRHAPASMVYVTVVPYKLIVDDDGQHATQMVAASTSTSSRGTGTGLAIVRWVANAHDAEFSLAPSPRGGLVATVTFPSPKTPAPWHAG